MENGSFLSKSSLTLPSWSIWVVMAVNLVLKAAFILYPDISLDEPFTIYHAQQSLPELMELFWHENNPPLHFLITHFSIKAFGTGPIAVRWFSVVCSVLTAGLLWKFARKYFGDLVALIGTLFFTLTNYHMFVSHEARPYALFGLLTVWSFYLFLGLEKGKRTGLVWLALANALLLYNHFLGFFVPFAQLVAVVIIREKRSLWWPFFFSGVGALVLYMPYLIVLLERVSYTADQGGTWVEPPTWTSPYYALWHLTNAPLPTLIAVFLVVFGGIRVLVFKNAIPALKVVWVWWVCTFFLMFALSFWFPMFLPKYLLASTFPYYLLTAIGIALLPLNRVGVGVSALIFLVMVGVGLKPTKNKRSVSEVGRWLREHKKETDLLVLYPHFLDIQVFYHYDRAVFEDYPHFAEHLKKRRVISVGVGETLPDSTGWDAAERIIYIGEDVPVLDQIQASYELSSQHDLSHALKPRVFVKKP